MALIEDNEGGASERRGDGVSGRRGGVAPAGPQRHTQEQRNPPEKRIPRI